MVIAFNDARNSGYGVSLQVTKETSYEVTITEKALFWNVADSMDELVTASCEEYNTSNSGITSGKPFNTKIPTQV